MRAAEAGFLLLSAKLGNPERKCLTTAQLRTLGDRVRRMERPVQDRELELSDLTALGYGADMAERILVLLAQEDLLEHYLRRGEKLGCVPVTRVTPGYPKILLKRLGLSAPGCLWARGDLRLLETPMVALVGSRELAVENCSFAREVGAQAARQGYTLVSGNARGADRTAQDACLAAGGSVISVVADELRGHSVKERVLYLSEESFDEGFSAQRALSRNRVIHALGEKTFVAQCAYQMGGTWDGTVKNLRFGWSPVFGFWDGSAGMKLLEQMGAALVDRRDLEDMEGLGADIRSLFDME